MTDAGAELIPVLGNHDYESGEEDETEEPGRPDRWYVDRVGPVRVVVLDSNEVDDEQQTDWLRGTLAEPQPTGTWTIVAMHHPAYSAGEHRLGHGGPRGVEPAVRGVRRAAGAGGPRPRLPALPAPGRRDLRGERAGAKLRPTGHQDFTAVSDSVRHYLDLLFYDDRVVGRPSTSPVGSSTRSRSIVDLSAYAGVVPTILTTPNTTRGPPDRDPSEARLHSCTPTGGRLCIPDRTPWLDSRSTDVPIPPT